MTVSIRRATVQDAPSIVEIIKLAFEEDAALAQIKTCLSKPDFYTCVAVSGEKIIGFVFGFPTISMSGEKRIELDLQAVHPDYQGQGAGKKLIDHFTHNIKDVDFIRVLVKAGNTRMEKALTSHGYSTDNILCCLYVSTESPGTALAQKIDVRACYSTPEKYDLTDSHPIPVTTMTYNGIWLEGKITPGAISSAFKQRQSDDDIVGAVIPEQDTSAIEALAESNFTFINHYRRWFFNPMNKNQANKP